MFKDAQKQVDDWVQQYKEPYWPPLSIFAHMAEELGEIGRVLNHTYGAKVKKETEEENSLGSEVTDLLFSLLCLANKEGVDLDVEFKKFMDEKCNGRDKDRFEKK